MADDSVRPPLRGHVTTTDVLKCIGVASFLIDHTGVFFDPAEPWWRLFGRVAAPIFFFLVGFARSRRVPWTWLALGAALTVSQCCSSRKDGMIHKSGIRLCGRVHQARHGRACPGHPRTTGTAAKTWIPGTSPGKTTRVQRRGERMIHKVESGFAAGPSSSSWPRLSRPSTNHRDRCKDVDPRDKPGEDDEGAITWSA
jgi:hypothetical protein